MRKLAGSELFDYAVKYLALRACSSDELRYKLRQKAAEAGEIDGVITRLKEIGYLDDARFAESFTANRMENQGFGKMRVLNDLKLRRVPAKLADTAVAQAFEGKDEAALVDAYIERRMSRLDDDPKRIAAAYRRLRRAGFSSGATLAGLKRFAKNAEIPDGIEAEEEES